MTIGSRIAAIVVLLAAAAGGVYFLTQRQSAANSPPKAPPIARGVPVLVATVERKPIPLSLNLVGRTESFASVTLRSRIDGQITDVHYQAGQPVKRGQKMITLDSRALQAQLQQGEANLARDRAQLAKAKADLARYDELVAKGFVSAAQLDTFRAAVDSLEATVRADLAAVDLARVNLGYTTVLSPMDGIAGAVLVFPGGSVKANDTNLVVINQVKPLYVTFSVPESRLSEIGRENDGAPRRVDVRLPSTKEAFVGQLSFVDNTVDAATGTIIMKARVDNADARLTPGQFVEVSVRLRELPDALVMPSEALQTGPDGTFVYVAKPDQTVEVRKVAARAIGNQRMVVETGLKEGERVITDGQLRLAPGAKYEVREPGARGRDGAKGGAEGKGGADGKGGPEGKGTADGKGGADGKAGAEGKAAAEGRTAGDAKGGNDAAADPGAGKAGRAGGKGAPDGGAPAGAGSAKG